MHNWIKESFRTNKPFDKFVAELVTAKGSVFSSGPANYFRINRNSSVLAESTAQLFLGVRLQCAKCHHHPFEKYSQAEIPALATKLKDTEVNVSTTLAVGDIIVHKLLHPEVFLARPENRYLPPAYIERARKGQEKHQLQFKGVEDFGPFKYVLEKYLLAALKHAGVRLVLGRDQPLQLLEPVEHDVELPR